MLTDEYPLCRLDSCVLPTIQSLLLQGSFGVVVKGVDVRTGVDVAVKQLTVAPEQAAEVAREMNCLDSLQHPNIVAYHGAYRDGSCVSIVMVPCSPMPHALFLVHAL